MPDKHKSVGIAAVFTTQIIYFDTMISINLFGVLAEWRLLSNISQWILIWTGTLTNWSILCAVSQCNGAFWKNVRLYSGNGKRNWTIYSSYKCGECRRRRRRRRHAPVASKFCRFNYHRTQPTSTAPSCTARSMWITWNWFGWKAKHNSGCPYAFPIIHDNIPSRVRVFFFKMKTFNN